ncbi:MAG: sulfatase [Halieaceae bacterium]|nr:sulfatase [Halieaceae bacterium]
MIFKNHCRPFVAFGLSLTMIFAAASEAPANEQRAVERPNIVLVLFEDMSSRIGALGDPVAKTPVIDALAKASAVYPNTFTTAGVCAPSRASLITGRYAPSIGAQHMRTHGVFGMQGGGPQNYYAVPPPEVRAFPQLLRAAGYYTSNNSKTDYQFGEPRGIWDANSDTANWRGRENGQPFFSMFTIMTTHESYLWPTDRDPKSRIEALVIARNLRELNYTHERIDPSEVTVPPYLPDTPAVRADIARQYDNIALADSQLADILSQLEEDGLLEETIVIVSTDHGDGLPRAKRSLYDSGLKVPMIIRFPAEHAAGTLRNELVSFVDLGPQILQWAGIPTPGWMQGQAFDQEDKADRQYIYATQDRMDTRLNLRRAVRDERYKLIVNYRPQDPYLEHLPFRDVLPTTQELWRGHAAGTLPPAAEFLFQPLPTYQLYDTVTDPHEINNLAGLEQYTAIQARLLQALEEWIARSDDSSFSHSEVELVEEFWPGGVQPVTQPPNFEATADGAWVLNTPTNGASIEWRCAEDDRWHLYVQPIRRDCATIEAVAQRYGYADSPLTVQPN